MNIKILRVFVAASLLIDARSIVSGGVSVMVCPSLVIVTPMDSSTSRSRFTSSILGTLWRVVVPLLRSEPARRATAPFFERFVTMVPDRG